MGQFPGLTFEFSLVLTSIVLGLGVTSLLSSIASLIENRERIKIYWVHLVWVLGVGVALFQYWWASWNMQRQFDWTLITYAVYSLYPSLLYIICELAFPKLDTDEVVDLEKHYFGHRKWIFFLAALLPINVFVHERLVFSDQSVISSKNLFRLIWVMMFAALWKTTNRKVHATSAVIVLLSLVTFLLMFG